MTGTNWTMQSMIDAQFDYIIDTLNNIEKKLDKLEKINTEWKDGLIKLAQEEDNDD